MAVGLDQHIVMVPSPSGQVPTPMPHPYIGKLKDKLSDDVEIGGKKAAVKGSKAKFESPGHFPMPPGTSFQNKPNDEAEVTGGCCDKVKINGKDACVLGSTATSCDDMKTPDGCNIVAMGASVVLPIMMPCIDELTFKQDGGFMINTRNMNGGQKKEGQDKKPKLSNAKWGSSSAKVGEEVTLEVSTSDLYEGATIYFSIWEEGFDPAVDVPVAKVYGPNKGNAAEAKWNYAASDLSSPKGDLSLKKYYESQGIILPNDYFKYRIKDHTAAFSNSVQSTAKFVFTAIAFKCDQVDSSSVEIGATIKMTAKTATGEKIDDINLGLVLADQSTESGSIGSSGEYTKQSVIPGLFQLKIGE